MKSRRKFLEFFADALRRLCFENVSAFRTVRRAGMGIEQAEIIVNFRDGRHRGPRVGPGGALFDGDGGGESFDMLNLGFLHPVEELPRVSGKTFHIAALSFRVQRVKCQRGFARSAQTRYDGQ